MNNKYSLIVHGGAWDIPADAHTAHKNGVEKALQAGLVILKNDGSAIDAACEAVRIMEDDPTFDAGIGSFLNREGEVEMDAIITSGADLSFGAVAALRNIRNPVLVAKMLRKQNEFCFLACEGAHKFAIQNNFEFFETERLLTGRELERYQLLKSKTFKTRQFFEQSLPGDTVGAVAMDKSGNLAAATSTGGTPNKPPGRIGDSPILGSGAYADNGFAAASSTGWGESIMKVMLAKTAVDFYVLYQNPDAAVGAAIKTLANKVDGRGGIILIDNNGHAAFNYNTPFMARAVGSNSGIQHVGI